MKGYEVCSEAPRRAVITHLVITYEQDIHVDLQNTGGGWQVDGRTENNAYTSELWAFDTFESAVHNLPLVARMLDEYGYTIKWRKKKSA